MVEIRDVTYIQMIAVKLYQLPDGKEKLVDVDGNRVIDINDVTLLQKTLAGL